MHQVKCKIYSKIQGKDKLLAPELDIFENIVVGGNTLVVIPRVYKARKFYMKKISVHEKNEHLYANVKKNTIGYKVFRGAIAKRKKKLV